MIWLEIPKEDLNIVFDHKIRWPTVTKHIPLFFAVKSDQVTTIMISTGTVCRPFLVHFPQFMAFPWSAVLPVDLVFGHSAEDVDVYMHIKFRDASSTTPTENVPFIVTAATRVEYSIPP